jgi:protein transport protein SEC24
VNPFVGWLENGRRWRCNICAQLNETPSAYFCHLDERNQRRDVAQRPELRQSVVEWVAPSEYMVRAPQAPAYFFVLDVSHNAVKTGMLASAASAIKNSLDDLPGGERTMIGFITFDTSVHYYSLKPGMANPKMLVVGDLNELFVPLPDDLLVYLKDSRDAVESFLDNLPTMFLRNTANEYAQGAVARSVGPVDGRFFHL